MCMEIWCSLDAHKTLVMRMLIGLSELLLHAQVCIGFNGSWCRGIPLIQTIYMLMYISFWVATWELLAKAKCRIHVKNCLDNIAFKFPASDFTEAWFSVWQNYSNVSVMLSQIIYTTDVVRHHICNVKSQKGISVISVAYSRMQKFNGRTLQLKLYCAVCTFCKHCGRNHSSTLNTIWYHTEKLIVEKLSCTLYNTWQIGRSWMRMWWHSWVHRTLMDHCPDRWLSDIKFKDLLLQQVLT